MSLGANIRHRRFQLNMTQQDLADAMGYKNRATIAKIESGENDVNQKKLKLFATVLQTSMEELIAGSSNISAPADTPISGSIQKSHKNVAVILAGGKSGRNQHNIPNQFLTVNGKPIIVFSMEAYQAHPLIDDIYIVCLKGWEGIVKGYSEQFGITKLRQIIPAGQFGITSLKAGFDFTKSLYSGEDIIVFQESTRPNVSVEIISKLLQSCEALGSANICMPMRDHLVFSIANGIQTVPDRESTIEVQSPEAYTFSVLDSIFKKAQRRNHPLSESCGAMLLYNLKININFVEGSIENCTKILRQEDLTGLQSSQLQNH